MNPFISKSGRALATLIAGVLGVAVGAGATASPRPEPAVRQDEPRVVEVIARRYAFEPAEIEVMRGERVRLLVRSGDGLHGFEIDKFGVSKDIPRGGDPVVIEFTADAAGRFPILCSIYCGEGHDDMNGTLVVIAGAATQP